jgi:hypothetical protein
VGYCFPYIFSILYHIKNKNGRVKKYREGVILEEKSKVPAIDKADKIFNLKEGQVMQLLIQKMELTHLML